MNTFKINVLTFQNSKVISFIIKDVKKQICAFKYYNKDFPLNTIQITLNANSRQVYKFFSC